MVTIIMKRHYAFIPLKDKDLSSFRKSLLISLAPRSVCALLMLVVLGFIGHRYLDLLLTDGINLILFSLAVAFELFLFFRELQKLYAVASFHKSSLLPYIHVRGLDTSFYIEELENGFVIQTEPVNPTDISVAIDLLADIVMNHAESKRLAEYLHACLNSPDHHLTSKAVIYVEIIRDQLEKGNKDILATYDKLVNFREDLC